MSVYIAASINQKAKVLSPTWGGTSGVFGCVRLFQTFKVWQRLKRLFAPLKIHIGPGFSSKTILKWKRKIIWTKPPWPWVNKVKGPLIFQGVLQNHKQKKCMLRKVCCYWRFSKFYRITSSWKCHIWVASIWCHEAWQNLSLRERSSHLWPTVTMQCETRKAQFCSQKGQLSQWYWALSLRYSNYRFRHSKERAQHIWEAWSCLLTAANPREWGKLLKWTHYICCILIYLHMMQIHVCIIIYII